jgi:hypothetical protein
VQEAQGGTGEGDEEDEDEIAGEGDGLREGDISAADAGAATAAVDMSDDKSVGGTEVVIVGNDVDGLSTAAAFDP